VRTRVPANARSAAGQEPMQECGGDYAGDVTFQKGGGEEKNPIYNPRKDK